MENIGGEKTIASSNRWGLIAILHEYLLDKCEQSKRLIEDEEYEDLNKVVNRTRDLLTELIILFKEKDEVSIGLREIYIYINTLITEGEIEKDKSYFEKVEAIVVPILEGFIKLEEKEESNIFAEVSDKAENLEENLKEDINIEEDVEDINKEEKSEDDMNTEEDVEDLKE